MFVQPLFINLLPGAYQEAPRLMAVRVLDLGQPHLVHMRVAVRGAVGMGVQMFVLDVVVLVGVVHVGVRQRAVGVLVSMRCVMAVVVGVGVVRHGSHPL